MGKNDPAFDNELNDIVRERFGNGLDKRPVGKHLVQNKIIKHPNWGLIKTDLKKFIFLPDNKKGQLGFDPTFNLFTIIVISFLAIIMLTGLIYSMGLINNSLKQVGLDYDARNPALPYGDATTCQAGGGYWSIEQGNCVPIAYVNMTHAADVTFGQANNATQGLRLVALTLIFSLILGTVVISSFKRVHPAFFMIYIFLTVLAIIFSVPVSNAYQNLLTTNIFDGMLQQNTAVNWLMINLPYVIAVVGILSGIFLFINIIRSEAEGAL